MYDTIREAAYAWVHEFNFVPVSIAEKLNAMNPLDMFEITPPARYDHVYIFAGEYEGKEGEVIRNDGDEYTIRLDDGEEVLIEYNCFNVLKEDPYPLWSTMFAFKEEVDNDWIAGEFGENGLQIMADLGFRIYESEDYRYVFGIDSGGHDFYEAYWIPLYKARGLRWHKESA